MDPGELKWICWSCVGDHLRNSIKSSSLMLQDKKASDSIESAMTVMQINPFMKAAMRQLKGIRLEATDDEIVLTLLSRVSWFKVRSCISYP